MTLETSYKKIMDHVVLTEDMRQRILYNIQNTKQSTMQVPFSAFPNFRRILSFAACFAVLAAGILTLTHFPSAPSDTNKPPVQSVRPNFQEVSSIQTLSEAVGFPVDELQTLPFDVINTHYIAFGTGLAEVKYLGSGNESAVYRKAPGHADPSGDYTQYDVIRELSVKETTITLKGTDDGFLLAVWFDESYAYSLRLKTPLSESAWIEFLQSIL